MLDGDTREAFDRAFGIVKADDFTRIDHRKIWQAMCLLASRNQPLDVVTLSQVLSGEEWFVQMGGLAYLATLAKDTPSAANIAHYAKTVRDLAVLRDLVAVGSKIQALGQDYEKLQVGEILNQAEALVYAIGEGAGLVQAGWRSYQEVLIATADRIEQAHNAGSHITGVRTGFPDLDEATTGLQSGDLVILAGRPSMGKSALAMGIAEHVAMRNDIPVAVFSLEMPAEQLAARGLASHARIDNRRLRAGRLESHEWGLMNAAMIRLSESKLHFDDTPGISPADIRSRCRRLAKDYGHLGMIVVDYLQLMRGDIKTNSREQEISGISRALKGIAKEFGCPVIALSQLNRELEKRTNKRPIPADLRDSGGLEQDADLILFVYRDEVYNPESPDKGTAELIIGKQRNGPLSTIKLRFEGEFTRFSSAAPDYREPEPEWANDYRFGGM